MRLKLLCLFLLIGGLFPVAQAGSKPDVNLILYRSLIKMEHADFIHLCDSFLGVFPKHTHDILCYRLRSNYDNSMLADAIYDLQALDRNPKKNKHKVYVDVSRIRKVLEPISADYLLVEEQYRAGYYYECIPVLQNIHTKCSFFWQTHYMLYQCLDSIGHHDSAMKAMEYGISQTSSPHLYAARVHKAYSQKNYSLALSDANYLNDNGYNDADIFFIRSKIYLDKGLIELALKDIQKASSLSPGNMAYMMHSARLYYYSDEKEVAYTLYSNSIRRGQIPDSIDAHIYLYCCVELEPRNIDGINQMLGLFPNNPDLYRTLVSSTYGYPDTTFYYLDEAIRRFPRESAFYASRAQLRWDRNREDPQIKKDYYTLIDLKPDTILWYKKLHTYLMYKNSKEAAVVRKRAQLEMHKLVEKDSTSAVNWFELARAYDLQDHFSESPVINRKAIDCYSKVIALDSTYYLAYYHRANLERWVNKNSDAYISDLTKAVALNENWVFRLNLAEELSKQNRQKEAIEVITMAIELHPYFINLYSARAEFYKKDNQSELAEKDKKKMEELRLSGAEVIPSLPFEF